MASTSSAEACAVGSIPRRTPGGSPSAAESTAQGSPVRSVRSIRSAGQPAASTSAWVNCAAGITVPLASSSGGLPVAGCTVRR